MAEDGLAVAIQMLAEAARRPPSRPGTAADPETSRYNRALAKQSDGLRNWEALVRHDSAPAARSLRKKNPAGATSARVAEPCCAFFKEAFSKLPFYLPDRGRVIEDA